MNGPVPLLAVEGLETRRADGSLGLRGASFTIREGEILAVLGPNGAGKSTLLETIAGLLPGQPRAGTIALDGRRIDRRHPEAIARAGVAFVAEDRGLFRELTVGENLELGTWGRPRDEARAELARVHALFPWLRDRAGQPAGTLSGGEQQMLAVGRSLLRRPRLLLLDEPSRGLAPGATRRVMETLVEASREGTAVLLVEQNARLALEVAHHAAVLEEGRIAISGTAAEIAGNLAVRDTYLGLTAEEAHR